MREWQFFLLILGCLVLKWKKVKGGEVCVGKNVWKIGRACGSRGASYLSTLVCGYMAKPERVPVNRAILMIAYIFSR